MGRGGWFFSGAFRYELLAPRHKVAITGFVDLRETRDWQHSTTFPWASIFRPSAQNHSSPSFVEDSSLLLGFLKLKIFFPQCAFQLSPSSLPGSSCGTGDGSWALPHPLFFPWTVKVKTLSLLMEEVADYQPALQRKCWKPKFSRKECMHWLWLTRDKLSAHLGAGTVKELGVLL